MNREQAKQLLPIIQAFADGETIQLQGPNGWDDLVGDCMSFNCHPDVYRIKPKPLERWAVLDRDSDGGMYRTPVTAESVAADLNKTGAYAPYRIVHMVEVAK